MLMVNKII